MVTLKDGTTLMVKKLATCRFQRSLPHNDPMSALYLLLSLMRSFLWWSGVFTEPHCKLYHIARVLNGDA